MGNCLIRRNQILAHEDKSHVAPNYKEEEATEQKIQACSASKSQMENSSICRGKKRKMVRFRLDDEEEIDKGKGILNQGDCKTGVLRIKLRVTQKELRELLNLSKLDSTNNSSVEQLLSSLELRRRKVSPDRTTTDNNVNGSWKPFLKTIPEEY